MKSFMCNVPQGSPEKYRSKSSTILLTSLSITFDKVGFNVILNDVNWSLDTLFLGFEYAYSH